LRPQKIAPSLLSADFSNLQAEVQRVTRAGADWLHVDVMDGHFVPNITIGPVVVQSLKKISPLPLDVHLMIENPEFYAEAFCKAGADYLTFHIEATKDPGALIQKIKSLGVRVGITLRPRTALEEILPWVDRVDLVLVMTVEPGFGGQSFMQDQVVKIQRLRQYVDQKQLHALIEVDGGVNDQTVQHCQDCDVLVAGSFIFQKDAAKAIQALKKFSK
jgi:ribulose-phosphate 3-epimerase